MIVLDANAFIMDVNFQKLAEKHKFYTHPYALQEIKDQRAKERLRDFLYDLEKKIPTAGSIKIVRQFAESTGDIASLSNTDIEIIALAVDLIESQGQLDLIITTPLKPLEFNRIVNVYPKKPQEPQEEEPKQDQNEEDDDGWIEVKPKTRPQIQPKVEEKDLEQEEDEEESESSDDEEGWITQENLKDKMAGFQVIGDDEDDDVVRVFVMTTDYSMQNVLLQMGIPILSQEGYKVKYSKRFVLECYSCKILERDVNKIFCSRCGQQSLLKVTCSIQYDGTVYLYRSKNFKLNLRGTQFDIPKQGRGKEMPIIYCADQLQLRGMKSKLQRQKKQDDNRFKKLLKQYDNGVGFDEVDLKYQGPKLKVLGRNLNPNDVNDMRKLKRKR